MKWNGERKEKLRNTLVAIYNSATKLKEFVSFKLDRNLNEIAPASDIKEQAFELIEAACSEGWIDNLFCEFCEINRDKPIVTQLENDFQVCELDSDSQLLGRICQELLNCLADLEQRRKQATGLEAEELDRKIDVCKQRLQYFTGVRCGAVEPVIPLPKNFSKEDLLRDAWGGREIQTETDSDAISEGCSAHLIVALFWQDQTNQKVRVQPRIIYQCPNTGKPIAAPPQKDRSKKLSDFPTFLQQAVDQVANKLSGEYPTQPWKITISLFVPIELLSASLTQWCGQPSQLIRDHPIVIGCSDRFEGSRAAKLYNKLNQGWQRFQNDVPDSSEPTSTLRQLNWLQSAPSRSQAIEFEDYSGLQCLGDWLKPDPACLDRWAELVESGIPLALWLCDAQAERAAIAQKFDQLTDCNRFEFLERIRRDRRQPCNLSTAHPGYHLGVFYEDPQYAPPFVPQDDDDDEQFFAWPA